MTTSATSLARPLPPARDVSCEKCLAKGHIVQAVEYVPRPVDPNALLEDLKFKAVALCMFCRDGDPCPGCATVARQKALASGTLSVSQAPVPAKRGRGVGRSTPRVSLDQVMSEYRGTPAQVGKFEKVDGIEVRYPSADEVKTRVSPGPKPTESDRYLDLVMESLSKCAEFRCPPDVSLHSFAARLSTRGRRRGKALFSIWRDKPHNTILVSYHPPPKEAAK